MKNSDAENLNGLPYDDVIEYFIQRNEINTAEAEVLRHIQTISEENFIETLRRLYEKYKDTFIMTIYRDDNFFVDTFEKFLTYFKKLAENTSINENWNLEYSISKSNSVYVNASIERIQQKNLLPPSLLTLLIRDRWFTFQRENIRSLEIELGLLNAMNIKPTLRIISLEQQLASIKIQYYQKERLTEYEQKFVDQIGPLILLLDIIERGKVESSNRDLVDLGTKMTGYLPYYDVRSEFEGSLESLTSQDTDISPLYGALSQNINDANLKLSKRYGGLLLYCLKIQYQIDVPLS